MSARVMYEGELVMAEHVRARGLAGESYEPVARLEPAAPAALPPLPGLTLDPAAVWR
jgi:hypothetical protein